MSDQATQSKSSSELLEEYNALMKEREALHNEYRSALEDIQQKMSSKNAEIREARLYESHQRRGQRMKGQLLGDGIGTEIKRLLEETDITGEAGCGCNQLASDLNRLSVEEAEKNYDKIVERVSQLEIRIPMRAVLASQTRADKLGLDVPTLVRKAIDAVKAKTAK